MPNFNYAYYYAKRKIRINSNGAHHEGFYLISPRLGTQLMQFDDVRKAVGFLNFDEHPKPLQDVAVDLEKTFHCVATKGLVGHVFFTLIPIDPTQPSISWNSTYSASITYSKTDSNFIAVKTFLIGKEFLSPGDKKKYKADPFSIKERRRQGE